jgi:uncharacterized repeat protein (TIGR01451 family)
MRLSYRFHLVVSLVAMLSMSLVALVSTTSPALAQGAPNLSVLNLIEDTPDAFTAGVASGYTYTISVTNLGDALAPAGAQVNIFASSGLIINTVSGINWTCTLSSCTSTADIAAAGVSTITIDVGVSSSAPPSVSLSAAVVVGGGSSSADDNGLKATPVNGTPDLTVSKTFDTTSPTFPIMVHGQLARFIIKVTNIGSTITTAPIQITDLAGNNLKIRSALGTGWNCPTLSDASVGCVYNSQVNGAGGTAPDLVVEVEPVNTTLTFIPANGNTVSVAGLGDTNPNNNSAGPTGTPIYPAPNVSIAKAVDPNVVVGLGDKNFTITVTNPGAATLGTVTVSDSLPSTVQFVSVTSADFSCTNSGNTVNCSRTATINNGDTRTITITFRPITPGATSNTATIGTQYDSDITNNSANVNFNIGGIDASVAKSLSGTLAIEGNALYTITVTNNSEVAFPGFGSTIPAGAITVNDTLPAEIFYNGGTIVYGGNGAFNCTTVPVIIDPPQTFVCTNTAPLTVGQFGTITFGTQARITSYGATNIINTATISLPAGVDLVAGNNSASATFSGPVPVPDLNLSVSVVSQTPNPFVPLDPNSQFVFDISNNSASSAVATAGQPFVLKLTFPSGVTAASLINSVGSSPIDFTAALCSFTAPTLTCTLDNGALRQAAPERITVQFTAPTVSGTFTVNASIEGANDPVVPADTEVYTFNINAPDLTIDKTHVGSFPRVRISNYTIKVTNNGNTSTTLPITVTDTLPTGLFFLASQTTLPVGWTTTNVDNDTNLTFTYTPNLLTGNANARTFTFAVYVDASAPLGTVNNTATVNSTQDPNSANNSDTDPTLIVAEPTPDLDATISCAPSTILTGGDISTCTLTVTNVSTTETTNVAAGSITAEIVFNDPAFDSGSNSAPAGWTAAGIGTDTLRWTSNAGTVLAPGASQAFTLNIVSNTTTGTFITTGRATLLQTELNTVNNVRTTGVTVQTAPTPDFAVTMSHVGNFIISTSNTYDIIVRNVSSTAFTAGVGRSVTMTTTLPAPDIAIASVASAPGWTCTVTAPNVSCSRTDSLAANTAYPTITINVNVGATPGTYAAGASITVTGVSGENTLNNNTTDSTIVTSGPQPDLTITEVVNNPYTIAVNGSFTITVENIGSAATAADVTVTKVMPTGFSVVGGVSGGGFTCSGTSTATCVRTAANPIPAGSGPQVITLQVVPSSSGTFANTSVSVAVTNDANTGNNTFTNSTSVIVNGIPDLTVSKTEQPTGNFLLSNGTGVYRITVTNVGTAATNGSTITVVDTLPSGMTYASATGGGFACTGVSTVTCQTTTIIAGGGTAFFDLTVNLSTTGTVVNNVTVIGGGDTSIANGSDTTTVDASPIPDLGITKTEFPSGSSFNVTTGSGVYRIIVTNNGTGSTNGSTITVVDTLPSGVTYVSHSSTGATFSCTGTSTVSCQTTQVLTVGSSATLDITVNIASLSAGTVINNVTVVGGGDSSTAAGSDTTTVIVGPAPNLTIDKSSVGSMAVNVANTFTIAVTNSGSAATSGTITVTDTLPSNFTFSSGSGGSFTCTASGQDVTCNRTSSMAASETATITLNVTPTTTGVVVNTATVVGGGDSSPASDDATVTIATAPDLSISKILSGGATSLRQNQNGSYDITIANQVGSAATSGTITMTDVLPPELTYVSATGAGFSCSVSGQTVTCSRTAAMSGGDSTTITLTVRPTVGGVTITNTATVSGGGDTNTSNNSASRSTTITAIDPRSPGSNSTFTISPTSLPADNTTVSTLTITIYQVDNVTVAANTTVTLQPSTFNGLTFFNLTGGVSGFSGLTNGSGQITFTVKSSVAQAVSIAWSATNSFGGPVTYNGAPPTVTFTAGGTGVVDRAVSTVTTDFSQIPADNTTKATITVTLKDTAGTAVAGKTVSLTASPAPATLLVENLGTAVSDANGVVRFTVRSSAQGTSTFTASVTDTSVIFLSQTVTIIFAAPGTQPVASTTGTGTPGGTSGFLTVPFGPVEGEVVAYRLRVRTGPGLDYPIIGLLRLGTIVSIVAKNERGNWFQIRLETGTAWVAGWWVRIRRSYFQRLPVVEGGIGTATLVPLPSPLIPVEGQGVGVVNTYQLRVRTGPGLGFQQIGLIKLGTEILLLGRSPDRAWYQIKTLDGSAWVSAYYVRIRRLLGNNLPTIEAPPVP